MKDQEKKQRTCCFWTFCMIVKVKPITVFVMLVTTHHCADGDISSVSLSIILSFFTGAEYLPPAGFESGAEMWFDPENIFPTASTCSLVLTLPTKYHNSPKLFQDQMIYALQNHGGFGML